MTGDREARQDCAATPHGRGYTCLNCWQSWEHTDQDKPACKSSQQIKEFWMADIRKTMNHPRQNNLNK